MHRNRLRQLPEAASIAGSHAVRAPLTSGQSPTAAEWRRTGPPENRHLRVSCCRSPPVKPHFCHSSIAGLCPYMDLIRHAAARTPAGTLGLRQRLFFTQDLPLHPGTANMSREYQRASTLNALPAEMCHAICIKYISRMQFSFIPIEFM